VQNGGVYRDSAGQTHSLADPSVSWFDEHNDMNLAVLYGGGLEIGFGGAPGVYLGAGVTAEQHLLNEWNDGFFAGAANYRYQAILYSAFVKYQSLR